jgi:hypothetical protein
MYQLKRADIERLLETIGVRMDLENEYEVHRWKQACPSGLFSTEIRAEIDYENTHYTYRVYGVGNIVDDGSVVWYRDLTIMDVTAD